MAITKVKISDSTSTTSSEIAASSTAVKAAMDKANSASTAASTAQTAANGAIKALSVSGKTITYTKGDGTTGTITTQDTNTTYSAGTGISISGTTISNSGVTSVTGATGAVTVAAPAAYSVSLKHSSTITAATTITVTNLTANKPVFMYLKHTSNDTIISYFYVVSGAHVNVSDRIHSYDSVSKMGGVQDKICIPTGTSIGIYVYPGNGATVSFYVFQ